MSNHPNFVINNPHIIVLMARSRHLELFRSGEWWFHDGTSVFSDMPIVRDSLRRATSGERTRLFLGPNFDMYF